MYRLNSFMEISLLKVVVVRKLRPFSGMWSDALMHREGLKGLNMLFVHLTQSGRTRKPVADNLISVAEDMFIRNL